LSVTPARRTHEQSIILARINGYKLRRRGHGTKHSFPVILWRIAPQRKAIAKMRMSKAVVFFVKDDVDSE